MRNGSYIFLHTKFSIPVLAGRYGKQVRYFTLYPVFQTTNKPCSLPAEIHATQFCSASFLYHDYSNLLWLGQNSCVTNYKRNKSAISTPELFSFAHDRGREELCGTLGQSLLWLACVVKKAAKVWGREWKVKLLQNPQIWECQSNILLVIPWYFWWWIIHNNLLFTRMVYQ